MINDTQSLQQPKKNNFKRIILIILFCAFLFLFYIGNKGSIVIYKATNAEAKEPVFVARELVSATREPLVATEQPIVPVEQVASSVEVPIVPVKQVVSPVEAPIVPVEELVAPVQIKKAPTKVKKASTKAKKVPAKTQEVPTKQDVSTKKYKLTTEAQNIQVKEQAVQVKEQITPTQENQTPTQENQTPTQENKAPAQELNVSNKKPTTPFFGKVPSLTQGHYVGIDMLGARSNSQFLNTTAAPDSKLNDNDYGVGFSYKYAFNINNFFFAPGIFGERTNLVINQYRPETITTYADYKQLKINNRYGLKADFGYDINNYTAFYFTGGVSRVNYKYIFYVPDVNIYNRQSINQIDYFYGAGLKFNIVNNIALNLEYNIQPFNPNFLKDYKGNKDRKVSGDLQIFKVGASYHF